MDTTQPFGSPDFAVAAKLFVALHRLFKVGQDESPEADSIRDALDAPLEALDPIEDKRAQWLSADLYSVSEPPPAFKLKEMNPQAQQAINEVKKAWKNQAWDHALVLLRRWKDYITPDLLSFWRGGIWSFAGHPDVATMFYGRALEIDPNNHFYQANYMACLTRSDPKLAREMAHQVLARSKSCATAVVAQAANILFCQIPARKDAETIQSYQKMIPVLVDNMERIESEGITDEYQVLGHSLTTLMLGSCYLFSGGFEQAINAYSRGLRVAPENVGMLTLRGILLYNSDSPNLTDFEEAIRLRSNETWSYFFLAHHALITSRFERCRGLCEAGLRMQGFDPAKSQLEDWRAIAQAELGFAPELVRAAFESAVRLDPSNETAKHNFEIFEASLQARQMGHQFDWERKSEAIVKQFAEGNIEQSGIVKQFAEANIKQSGIFERSELAA